MQSIFAANWTDLKHCSGTSAGRIVSQLICMEEQKCTVISSSNFGGLVPFPWPICKTSKKIKTHTLLFRCRSSFFSLFCSHSSARKVRDARLVSLLSLNKYHCVSILTILSPNLTPSFFYPVKQLVAKILVLQTCSFATAFLKVWN